MEDPKTRLTKCVSTPELERRWKAVREMMRARKIDYLVIQNQSSGGRPGSQLDRAQRCMDRFTKSEMSVSQNNQRR